MVSTKHEGTAVSLIWVFTTFIEMSITVMTNGRGKVERTLIRLIIVRFCHCYSYMRTINVKASEQQRYNNWHTRQQWIICNVGVWRLPTVNLNDKTDTGSILTEDGKWLKEINTHKGKDKARTGTQNSRENTNLSTKSSCSCYSMQVRVRIFWHVIVKHNVNSFNIHPTTK